MSPREILRTRRLVLRDAGPQDVDAVHAVASDFDVVRSTGTWVWPPDREFTASRCKPIAADQGVGGAILRDDTVIGLISIADDGTFGYMLGRARWGQGYATEMGRAVINHAIAIGRWQIFSACVFDDNPASSRVLEKLGFSEGALCRGHCASRGAELPTRNFTLSARRA